MSHSAVSDPIQANSVKSVTSANGLAGKGPHARINKVAVLVLFLAAYSRAKTENYPS